MQDERFWQAVVGEAELSISHGNYVTWFKNTKLLKFKDNVLTIGVANVFVKQQLSLKYNKLVDELLAKNHVFPDKIEYKIHTDLSKAVKETEETIDLNPSNNTPIQSQAMQYKSPAPNSLSHSYRQGLNETYTFDNFIVGGGSELAYAACQAIASDPGKKYNPLFLYGGVGIGKTHLMQAVGNAVLTNRPGSKVVYITSEQFVQEFVDALRFKKASDFASYYRTTDVLIIDDVQFIAGKEKMQEEFFHTFNALHQANKQIIISADKPPRDILTLEERLRSRLAWGMSIDMQSPDFETRCAIIQSKSEAKGMVLPTNVVEYLSTHVQTNIRELEGALNQLIATCEMRNVAPDITLVSSMLGANSTRPKHISARQVVERISKHFQVPMDELLGPKRDKDIVVPRQVAMYILRSELDLSFPKIARELGRKDHTTAIHSVAKVEQELTFDAIMRQHVSEIRETLYA